MRVHNGEDYVPVLGRDLVSLEGDWTAFLSD
jgi:hypothetical protein